MTLLIDTNPIGVASNDSGPTIVSSSFSPPANSLVVLLIGSNSDSAQTVLSVTDTSTGGPLSWKAMVAATGASANAEIWIADCPSSQASITATATFVGTTAYGAMMGVVVFTGAQAAATQFTNRATLTNAANSLSGTPSCPLPGAGNTTANGSWVVGACAHFGSGTGPNPAAGQTDVFNGNAFAYQGVAGVEEWAQRTNTAITSAGTPVTISDTAPTSIQFAMAVMEVLVAASAINTPKSVTGTATFTGGQVKLTKRLLIA